MRATALLALLCILGGTKASGEELTYPASDGPWSVTSYVGEPWFAEPDEILGKTQRFYKGMGEGVFYSCDYGGQSMTYTRYTLNEFLSNKEFKIFNKFKEELGLDDSSGALAGEFFVHRISCNSPRQVFYPFVTFDSSIPKAFYLFEGAVYELVAE